MSESIFLNKELRNDNVFVPVEMKPLSELTGMPSRTGLENAVISGGKIVNIASNWYGLLKNEDFFLKVEEKLIEADIQYVTRSINRGDRSFVVDYILSDDNYHVDVKTGGDIIVPMIRAINYYDGGGKSSGHFGFFRKVCDNGLHVAHSKIGFAVSHMNNIVEVTLPNIENLVQKFISNEYYDLRKKFQVLAEKPITDLSEFVRFVATKSSLFKYETSEKNPEPSKSAEFVLDILQRESNDLGTGANLWLGYNAFNEFIHKSEKASFDVQKRKDAKVFDLVLEMAGVN